MGGGYIEEPYQQQDQVYPNMRDYPEEVPQTHEEVPEPPPELPKQIIDSVGEKVGYWTILGLMVLGAFFFFRKKIKSILKSWILSKD